VRWRNKPKPEWQWRFAFWSPIVLDAPPGQMPLHVQYEWVQYKDVTEQSDYWTLKGYTEYRDKNGDWLGRRTWG
jgi:hypothetical protein